MRAICLVVVRGGVAEVYAPEHVDCRVVDLDDAEGWHGPHIPNTLPRDIGFEALVAEADLIEGTDYVYENYSYIDE